MGSNNAESKLSLNRGSRVSRSNQESASEGLGIAVGMPIAGTPRTDPDMRTSRIRLLSHPQDVVYLSLAVTFLQVKHLDQLFR